MLDRHPGVGPYARLEREQRWLLQCLPADVVDPVDIEDLYLTGTTLRLRRMRSGSVTVHKLGQKVRADPDSPERVALTNIYLRQDEFEVLGQLPGAALRKTRWRWHPGGGLRPVAVDEFQGSLDGLILAEVELADDDPFLRAPDGAIADVTDETRYSGGSLAHLSPEAASTFMHEVGTRRGAAH